MLPLLSLAIPACTQTIDPQLFNSLQWRLIGPFRAGRAVAVGGVSGGSPIFYFGSVDGGVWKTGDAGMVWSPMFDTQPVASVGALAVAPSDPQTVYVGTGETDIRSDLASGNGVYKSNDGGASWTHLGLDDTRQISRIVIDPADPKIVYAGAFGDPYGPSKDRGVYKSIDGGKSWRKVLYTDDSTGVADLALASQQPNLLFACMWNGHRPPWSQYPAIDGPGSGLYRSRDGGATWQHLEGHGLPEGQWGRSGIAVSPDGQHIYALIDAPKPGIYASDDGGGTWEYRNGDTRLTGRAWYFSRITVDPLHPAVVYVPNTALYRSEDGGKTLGIVRGAPGGDDYHELWIDAKDSNRMVLGTDHGTTISIDRGKTWTSWYNQPTGQFYHVTTDDSFPYVVFGAQQDDGTAGVPSRSDHERLNARDWFIAAQSESGYVAVDRVHKQFLYVSGPNGSVVRFDRRTSLSKDITPWPLVGGPGTNISDRKYRDTWTPVLVMSQADGHSLYFGTQYLLRSIDGGAHWDRISPDLTGAKPRLPSPAQSASPPTIADAAARGYGTIYTIAPSPLQAKTVWTGSETGLVYLTRDGGVHWTNVTPPVVGPWSKISLIEASHFDPAVAYIAVDRHRLSDREPYLYRTRDFGKTWQRINEGISAPSFTYAVHEDAKRKDLLFAGTEFGVYVSFNSGDRWQPLQRNLPVTSVRDLDVHGDDLVIATHGRAFWIMDDIAPLRQVLEANQARKPFFYQPATAVRVDHDPFPSTRVPVDEPTASNPDEGAEIDYYLPAAAHRVSLIIYDAKGELVRTYSSDRMTPPRERRAVVADAWILHPAPLSAEPGMHRFAWSLSWSDTGEVDSNLPNQGSGGPPTGPRAVPGMYRVVLDVDGMQITRSLKVVRDPRSVATEAALNAQFELGRKLYAACRETEGVIAEVRTGLASQKSDMPTLQKLLDGTDTEGRGMGLVQIEALLNADLNAVHTGADAPTAQEAAVYRTATEAMHRRMIEWKSLGAQQTVYAPRDATTQTDAAGRGASPRAIH